jgi:uncharacterized protein (TIGR02118 family)
MAETTYYKILLFMKRRPGMSMEEFQDYYENRHVPLCLKYSGGVSRYMRRFITAHPNPDSGESGELPYDVITELWFEDEATYRGTVEYLSTAVMPDEVVADERNLFDRTSIRMATIIERETEMGS